MTSVALGAHESPRRVRSSVSSRGARSAPSSSSSRNEPLSATAPIAGMIVSELFATTRCCETSAAGGRSMSSVSGAEIS